jgi:nanoRNase/pAp phosphatase (c-di-AMP/oligoRNAs hydrolase)
VIDPSVNPYFLLSMTISGTNKEEKFYWNKLVKLLGYSHINDIHQDADVKIKVANVLAENKTYKKYLTDFTFQKNVVSITDFLGFEIPPSGNRFLVFTLFPKSTVNIKVRFKNRKKDQVIISIGHNIFNRKCRVNIGDLVKNYGGGGHYGAGSCCVEIKNYQESLTEMINLLSKK